MALKLFRIRQNQWRQVFKPLDLHEEALNIRIVLASAERGCWSLPRSPWCTEELNGLEVAHDLENCNLWAGAESAVRNSA